MSEKGILLAVSSLPGKYAIGDFSHEAIDFIKLLKKYNIKVWQILPLNPVGHGHSPYQQYSSFAFDEIYISIDDLQKRGLVDTSKEIEQRPRSNYETARKIKEEAIAKAFFKFIENHKNLEKIQRFLDENRYIKEYCEYAVLKKMNNNLPWNEWKVTAQDNYNEFFNEYYKRGFAQMLMMEQWSNIKSFANDNGIRIIGDVPFYVGYDSSDVYFNKESFLLDENHNPSSIAGVPPDYFCELGQRWGNPIWNWDYLYQNDFKLMMDRIAFAAKLYDVIRIDHFRAFDSYWAINPNCPTAVDGEWRYPDGYRFFNRLYEKYPEIKLLAEDLGMLREEVYTLRDHFNLPGIRVLQFTIDDDEFNNKRIEKENMIYYTGTHDNETLNEWISKQPSKERNLLSKRMKELAMSGETLQEQLIHYALSRKEKLIVFTAQDLMNLDKKSRMNCPGFVNQINWTFKLTTFNDIEKSLRKFFK